MLISSAVTVKLICVFVFAYTESRFSYDAADICSDIKLGYRGPDMSRHFYMK